MTFEKAQLIVSGIRNAKYNIKDLLIKDSNERNFVLSSLKDLENEVWQLVEK